MSSIIDVHSREFILSLRLFTLVVLVALLTIHVRSVRVFRWEQSVSGGVLVTFCVAELGLALCAGNGDLKALQIYLCGVGAPLLAINSAVIWQRWHSADEMTRVVAELLQSLGMPLRRHVMTKVVLSAAAALGLLLDLILMPVLHH